MLYTVSLIYTQGKFCVCTVSQMHVFWYSFLFRQVQKWKANSILFSPLVVKGHLSQFIQMRAELISFSYPDFFLSYFFNQIWTVEFPSVPYYPQSCKIRPPCGQAIHHVMATKPSMYLTYSPNEFLLSCCLFRKLIVQGVLYIKLPEATIPITITMRITTIKIQWGKKSLINIYFDHD